MNIVSRLIVSRKEIETIKYLKLGKQILLNVCKLIPFNSNIIFY